MKMNIQVISILIMFVCNILLFINGMVYMNKNLKLIDDNETLISINKALNELNKDIITISNLANNKCTELEEHTIKLESEIEELVTYLHDKKKLPENIRIIVERYYNIYDEERKSGE